MKINKNMNNRDAHFKYTLQRTMIIYFLLIGFAALLLGIEFISEVYNSALRGAWLVHIEEIVGQTINSPDIFQPLDRLGYKAILMIGIIMSVVIIVLSILIKKITGPLQHMIEKSNEISKGDLSQTIHIDSNNELADLGGVINDMSSNLQEISLFSLNTTITGKKLISDATALLDQSTLQPEVLLEIREKLTELDTELTTLKSIVDCFKFYSIDQSPHE